MTTDPREIFEAHHDDANALTPGTAKSLRMGQSYGTPALSTRWSYFMAGWVARENAAGLQGTDPSKRFCSACETLASFTPWVDHDPGALKVCCNCGSVEGVDHG